MWLATSWIQVFFVWIIIATYYRLCKDHIYIYIYKDPSQMVLSWSLKSKCSYQCRRNMSIMHMTCYRYWLCKIKCRLLHWSGNVVILSKFSSPVLPEDFKVKISYDADEKNYRYQICHFDANSSIAAPRVVKMVPFQFMNRYMIVLNRGLVKTGQIKSLWMRCYVLKGEELCFRSEVTIAVI